MMVNIIDSWQKSYYMKTKTFIIPCFFCTKEIHTYLRSIKLGVRVLFLSKHNPQLCKICRPQPVLTAHDNSYEVLYDKLYPLLALKRFF